MSFFFSLGAKSSPFTVSIYCEGDSTTAYPDNYTLRMKGYLEPLFENLTVNVTNVATSSESQAQMLTQLPTQILAYNPDIVTLSTYLNDTTEYNNGTLSGNIDSYINQVLNHVNPSTGKAPLLLLMTDNVAGENVGQAYYRPYSTQVAIKNVVLGKINQYVNNTTVWKVDRFKLYDDLGGGGIPNTSQLFAVLRSDDKVHPNLLGYTTVDEPAIYPVLRNMIEKIRLFK